MQIQCCQDYNAIYPFRSILNEKTNYYSGFLKGGDCAIYLFVAGCVQPTFSFFFATVLLQSLNAISYFIYINKAHIQMRKAHTQMLYECHTHTNNNNNSSERSNTNDVNTE